MPKLVDPLKDIQVKNAKPKDKPYKLSDGGGLYLLVNPNGSKGWRLKYRFQGNEKLLSLGVYPEISLREARERQDAARKLLDDGVDPSDNRKAAKAAGIERAANSFEAVAREWLGKNQAGWAKTHYSKILGRFENDVFPYLGNKPISTISCTQPVPRPGAAPLSGYTKLAAACMVFSVAILIFPLVFIQAQKVRRTGGSPQPSFYRPG